MHVQSSLPFDAPEEWRGIPGYEGRFEVSNLGRVRALRFRNGGTDKLRTVPLVLKGRDAGGYRCIPISMPGRPWPVVRKVHQMVLEAFVGPRPPGHVGAHLNGNPTDNRLINLTWATYAENSEHSRIHGTVAMGADSGARTHPERLARGERHGSRTRPEQVPRGETHGNAKITEADVREIREAARHESSRAIAERYAISARTVRKIVAHARWGHVG